MLAVLALAGEPAAVEPPARVVSINLCTDQLALLLASPGQLVSVSRWGAVPSASNLAAEAAGLPLNGGGAEEVFLMRPDLVLAGTFTNRAAVDMLRRLGVTVEVFPPARSMGEVTEALLRMGRLLGREAVAEDLAADFEARMETLAEEARRIGRDTGAYHYANGYTSGDGTLASDVMDRAGLDNAAAAAGLRGSARLELEALVMLRPFLIRTEHISGASEGRAFETARHPAIEALAAGGRGAVVEERRQVCATPFVAEAVAAIVEARRGSGGAAGREGE